MLYVGVKQQDIPTLRTALESTKPGKHGSVTVLGGKGDRKGTWMVAPAGAEDGAAAEAAGSSRPSPPAVALAPGATTTLHHDGSDRPRRLLRAVGLGGARDRAGPRLRRRRAAAWSRAAPR